MKQEDNNTILSIIVPVYNVEAYLENCIESLLNQKIDNYEIILIDDGSTDKSGEICDQYDEKYEQIKVIHKTNGGLSSARNTGIMYAEGKYIGFVDGDDYIAPQMYDNLIRIAKKYNAQIATCEYFSFFNPEEVQSTIEVEVRKKDRIHVYTNQEALKEFFIRNIPESVCTNIYLTDLWKNRRFVEGEITEDTTVVYELLASAEKTVMLEKQFYGYRRRTGSITNLGYSDEFKIVREHMSYLESDVKEKYPNLLPYMYHFWSVHYFCLLNAIVRNEKFEMYASDYQLYRKQFKKLIRYFVKWEKLCWKEYIIAFILITPFNKMLIKRKK